ncbi:hypothetical protein MTO96_001853 [Rhipicephalus appendiculatus]
MRSTWRNAHAFALSERGGLVGLCVRRAHCRRPREPKHSAYDATVVSVESVPLRRLEAYEGEPVEGPRTGDSVVHTQGKVWRASVASSKKVRGCAGHSARACAMVLHGWFPAQTVVECDAEVSDGPPPWQHSAAKRDTRNVVPCGGGRVHEQCLCLGGRKLQSDACNVGVHRDEGTLNTVPHLAIDAAASSEGQRERQRRVASTGVAATLPAAAVLVRRNQTVAQRELQGVKIPHVFVELPHVFVPHVFVEWARRHGQNEGLTAHLSCCAAPGRSFRPSPGSSMASRRPNSVQLLGINRPGYHLRSR